MVRLPLVVGPGARSVVAPRKQGNGSGGGGGDVCEGRIDLAYAGESDGRSRPGGGRSDWCLLRFTRDGIWAVLGRSAEFVHIRLGSDRLQL